MELSIVTGSKNQTVFVRASNKATGKFGIVTRKTAFIEVDSMKSAEELKAAIESNELAVVFGKLNPQNGNYDATVLAVESVEAPAGELKTEA